MVVSLAMEDIDERFCKDILKSIDEYQVKEIVYTHNDVQTFMESVKSYYTGLFLNIDFDMYKCYKRNLFDILNLIKSSYKLHLNGNVKNSFVIYLFDVAIDNNSYDLSKRSNIDIDPDMRFGLHHMLRVNDSVVVRMLLISHREYPADPKDDHLNITSPGNIYYHVEWKFDVPTAKIRDICITYCAVKKNSIHTQGPIHGITPTELLTRRVPNSPAAQQSFADLFQFLFDGYGCKIFNSFRCILRNIRK